jgi:hypothetical protein
MRASTLFALLASLFSCALFAAPAQAQRDRVFVASYGSDSNPCTFGSPCKTFQNAYNVVAVGGEVTAIDSAGFGPLAITTSVTITSPDGVEAGIAAAAGDTAIAISAGSTDVVVLHGLTLDGTNAAADGISFNGGSLVVEKCVIRNMTANGIDFAPIQTTASLAVSESSFINNGTGINIEPKTTGMATVSIDRSGLYANQNFGLYVVGVDGSGTVDVGMTDSVVANTNGGNAVAGIYVTSGLANTVTDLSLTHVLAEGNIIGFYASGSHASIYLGQSTATGNEQAWTIATSAHIYSYDDNYLSAGNQVASAGTLTDVSHQ